MPERIFFHHHDAPIGPLLLLSDGGALTGLYTARNGVAREVQSPWIDDASPFRDVKAQLNAYFAGRRSTFDLPLCLGGTPFQKTVWAALLTIPHGTTISYRELAVQIGNTRAVRAVGRANGQNPISIIVPCHRVVGANGDLVGYGGGLDNKRWLLGHEHALAPEGTRWREDHGSWAARAAAVVR